MENLLEEVNNLKIEDSCLNYFKLILPTENSFIRISVESGGCSGFQYSFYIDNPPLVDSDIIINANPTVIVDNISMKYLKGAIVKFENTPFTQRVYIENPNAVSSCGCGSSFYCDTD